MDDPIRLALALSGGTAKSVAHIGALMAFEDAGIQIERLAGTSGGAIVGAHYAAGMALPEIAAHARRTKLTDLGGIGFRRLGLLSSDKLYRMLVERIGEITFAELRIPLSIVVTNLLSGEREVLEAGIVARAAQASACIPQIYAPVRMNGGLYVDGGLVEYMPTRALLPHNPDLIVGINLGAQNEPADPRHMLSLVMRTVGIVGQQNAVISARHAHVVICPDLRRFSPFEIKEADAMIKVGYEETERQIPAIRHAWEDAHSIKSRVSRMWRRALGAPSRVGEEYVQG
jgi:NTE family protein